MNIAVCIRGEKLATLLENVIRTDFPDAEFSLFTPETLPYGHDRFHMVLCDEEALIRIWQSDKLRAYYLPGNAIAIPIYVSGEPKIFYKSYTNRGLRVLGLPFGAGSGPTSTVPLFHSLDEITENGKADDYLIYYSETGADKLFAVRYGNDTLIAEYADRVKSGSRTIFSVAGERRVGRLRIHKDGVSVEGTFYSFDDCEKLPLYVIARIKKVLVGRN